MDENSVETLCDLGDLYITQQDYEKCEYNHLQLCVKYTAPVYQDMCDFVLLTSLDFLLFSGLGYFQTNLYLHEIKMRSIYRSLYLIYPY